MLFKLSVLSQRLGASLQRREVPILITTGTANSLTFLGAHSRVHKYLSDLVAIFAKWQDKGDIYTLVSSYAVVIHELADAVSDHLAIDESDSDDDDSESNAFVMVMWSLVQIATIPNLSIPKK